MGLISLGEL
ncbi:hypothetical protein LEMLEM_LOCUS2905 [Lemmus lemmus]